MRRRLAAAWDFLTRPRGRAPHPWTRPPGGGRRSGIALLMVVGILMFLTVLATDVNYGAHVRLRRAVHVRDHEAATWLARSGVNVYRLVLVANKQLARSSSLTSLSELAGVNLGDALWRMLPAINTGIMRMLFVQGSDVSAEELAQVREEGVSEEVAEESREKASRFADRGFLDFPGDFAATIRDEESRVNVSLLTAVETESLLENPAALQLYGLMSGEENDQWFYERNIDRWEIIANLKDWMDADTERSGGLGGYEDNLYQRLDDPYHAKNAPLDTLEEIRLVEGWQGEVFDRFRDQLTIYGPGKININTAGDEVVAGLLKAWLTPAPSDLDVQVLLNELHEYRLLYNFSKGQDFVDWLVALGREPKEGLADLLDTQSMVFTVESTGMVGDSVARIRVVMDFSKRSEGEILYWRTD